MCFFQSALDLLREKWTKKTQTYTFLQYLEDGISWRQEQQAATMAVDIRYAQILHAPKKESDTPADLNLIFK